MKKCVKCYEVKDLSVFYKNKQRPDGYNSWCKPCHSEYERLRYQNGDKARKVNNNNRTKAKNHQIVWDHLQDHPCVDCGETDPLVLEFDHIADDKIRNISTMYHGTQKALLEEIAKCEVRCSNCHKRKTAKDFNNWKLSYISKLDIVYRSHEGLGVL